MNGNMAVGMCVNTPNTLALFELVVFHEIITSPIKLVCDMGKNYGGTLPKKAPQISCVVWCVLLHSSPHPDFARFFEWVAVVTMLVFVLFSPTRSFLFIFLHLDLSLTLPLRMRCICSKSNLKRFSTKHLQ